MAACTRVRYDAQSQLKVIGLSSIHTSIFGVCHKPSICLSSSSGVCFDRYMALTEAVGHSNELWAAEGNRGKVTIQRIFGVRCQHVIKSARMESSLLMWIHLQLKVLMVTAHLITLRIVASVKAVT